MTSSYPDDKTEKSKFPKYIIVLNIKIFFPNSGTACTPITITTHKHCLSFTQEAGAGDSGVYHLGLFFFLTDYEIPVFSKQVQFYRANCDLPQKCSSNTGKHPKVREWYTSGQGLAFHQRPIKPTAMENAGCTRDLLSQSTEGRMTSNHANTRTFEALLL